MLRRETAQFITREIGLCLPEVVRKSARRPNFQIRHNIWNTWNGKHTNNPKSPLEAKIKKHETAERAFKQ